MQASWLFNFGDFGEFGDFDDFGSFGDFRDFGDFGDFGDLGDLWLLLQFTDMRRCINLKSFLQPCSYDACQQ